MGYVLRNALKNGKPTPGYNYFSSYDQAADRFVIVDRPDLALYFNTLAQARQYVGQNLPHNYGARWIPEEFIPDGQVTPELAKGG